MHLIPNNLASAATFSDRTADGGRFQLSGVELRVHGDGTFSLNATDGKRALRVTGPCGDRNQYPDSKAVAMAPNGAVSAIIPAKTWETAMTKAQKLTRKVFKPELKSVAVVLNENVTTLVATDLDTEMVEKTKNIEGNFPPVAEVIPPAGKAMAEVTINPVLLADSLYAFAKLRTVPDEALTLELHRLGIVFRDQTEAGLQLAGLLASFSTPNKNKPGQADPLEAEPEPVTPAWIEPDLSRVRIEIGTEVMLGRCAVTRLSKNQYRFDQNGWVKYATYATPSE